MEGYRLSQTGPEVQEILDNAGIAPESVVTYIDNGEHTDEEKRQARQNIGFGDGCIDEAPTEGSDRMVTSGGVYDALTKVIVDDVTVPNLITITTNIQNIAFLGEYRLPFSFVPEDYTARMVRAEVHTNVDEQYVTAHVVNSDIVLTVHALPSEPTDMRVTLNCTFATVIGAKTVSGISEVIGLNYKTPQARITNKHPDIRTLGTYYYPFELGPEDFDSEVVSIVPTLNVSSDKAVAVLQEDKIEVTILEQEALDYTLSLTLIVTYANGLYTQASTISVVHPAYPHVELSIDSIVNGVGEYDVNILRTGYSTALLASMVPTIICDADNEPVPTIRVKNNTTLTLTVAKVPYNTILITIVCNFTYSSGETFPVTYSLYVIGQEGLITRENNPEVMRIIAEYTDWSRSSEKITYEEVQQVTDIGTVFSRAAKEHPYMELREITEDMTPAERAEAEAYNSLAEVNNAEADKYQIKIFNELQYFPIEEIPAHAFEECVALTEIKTPSYSTTVNAFAFWKCMNLQKYNYVQTNRCIINGMIGEGAFGITRLINPQTAGSMDITAQLIGTLSENFINPFALLGKVSDELLLYAKSGNNIYIIHISNLSSNNYINIRYINSLHITHICAYAAYNSKISNGTHSSSVIFGSMVYGETQDRFCPINAIIGPHAFERAEFLAVHPVLTGESVGNYAFNEASGLTYLQLKGVSEVGEYAFNGLSDLKIIRCDGNQTQININSFNDCGTEVTDKKLLTQANFDASSLWYSVIQRSLGYEKDSEIVINNASNPVLASYFTNLPDGLYAPECALIKSFSNLPAEPFPFHELRYFISITQLTGINDCGISSFTLPASVTYIDCFQNCPNLAGDLILSSSINIAAQAFTGTTLLSSIRSEYPYFRLPCHWNAELIDLPYASPTQRDIEYYNSTQTYQFFSKKIKEVRMPLVPVVFMYQFLNATGLDTFDFSIIQRIGNYAFSGNGYIDENEQVHGLRNIDLSNVIEIKEYAFADSKALNTVTLSDNLTTIPSRCFLNSSLSSINMPRNLQRIDLFAFEGSKIYTLDLRGVERSLTISQGAFLRCFYLRAVLFPESPYAITIDFTSLFSQCSSLTSISYHGAIVLVQGGISTETSQAFYRCTSLYSVDIPQAHTMPGFSECTYLNSIVLGTYNRVPPYGLKNCDSLTSLTVPAAIIDANALDGCDALEELYLLSPDTIGDEALKNCVNLSILRINKITAPTVGINAFYGVGTTVPAGQQKTLVIPADADETTYSTGEWAVLLANGFIISKTL